jgi:hypothetical protein
VFLLVLIRRGWLLLVALLGTAFAFLSVIALLSALGLERLGNTAQGWLLYATTVGIAALCWWWCRRHPRSVDPRSDPQ